MDSNIQEHYGNNVDTKNGLPEFRVVARNIFNVIDRLEEMCNSTPNRAYEINYNKQHSEILFKILKNDIGIIRKILDKSGVTKKNLDRGKSE